MQVAMPGLSQASVWLCNAADSIVGYLAKHRLAPYSSTPQSWFKVLNPDYSQKRGRRELFDKFRERNQQVNA
jgi:hypothetical protein